MSTNNAGEIKKKMIIQVLLVLFKNNKTLSRGTIVTVNITSAN